MILLPTRNSRSSGSAQCTYELNKIDEIIESQKAQAEPIGGLDV